ncbi:MAG: aliphatic sulfonates ABC transporter substrate-binding protein, partial [Pseudolabrys sp.]|nr:aliphatic sulfonates ABC transporter substrate-binding protein [Pseudolabrys sp.]
KFSLANYDEEKKSFQAATKLSDTVADKQLKERTTITFNKIGAEQRDSILQAGIALQKAGVLPADVNVQKAVDDLIADQYVATN